MVVLVPLTFKPAVVLVVVYRFIVGNLNHVVTVATETVDLVPSGVLNGVCYEMEHVEIVVVRVSVKLMVFRLRV